MNAAHTDHVAIRQAPSSSLRSVGFFLRHLGEMVLAMMLGMLAAVPILWVIFGAVLAPTIRGMTPREVANQFPVLICLVVAVSMSVPMVAWMRHRGHSSRSCAEMTVAMAAPLVPIFGLLWLQLIPGASACGLYCATMIPAMAVAMLFRLDRYTGHTSHAM